MLKTATGITDQSHQWRKIWEDSDASKAYNFYWRSSTRRRAGGCDRAPKSKKWGEAGDLNARLRTFFEQRDTPHTAKIRQKATTIELTIFVSLVDVDHILSHAASCHHLYVGPYFYEPLASNQVFEEQVPVDFSTSPLRLLSEPCRDITFSMSHSNSTGENSEQKNYKSNNPKRVQLLRPVVATIHPGKMKSDESRRWWLQSEAPTRRLHQEASRLSRETSSWTSQLALGLILVVGRWLEIFP